MKNIKSVKFDRKTGKKASLDFLNKETASKAREFHKSFNQYKETPLTTLENLADEIGVSNIFVKDESHRFNLNAFKVLGCSYAIGNYMADKIGVDIDELSYEKMISEEVKAKTGDITFVTATDGNHGRGVAWTANKLNQKSVVYMPKGSAQDRLENIKAEGSEAIITEMNYDEAVGYANEIAEKNDWVLIQDTAWEGYNEIPTWIMQGYTTMALETYEQLGDAKPTHIFIQAGVGSLAASIQGFFSSVYGENRPITTIVEPNKADCIYKTAKKNDGKIHFVTGEMDTIMAGLACGEPNPIAWDVLKDYSDGFISAPDYLSAKGVRVLANPLKDDKKIISGESGSIGIGLLVEIMQKNELKWLKDELKLNKNSKVLFFNTEGDTDQENYKKILWDGEYSRIS